jgi:D-lactate dehydrogenase (cytochrome)
MTLANHLPRVEPKALAAAIEALSARLEKLLVTSKAVREHHGHTTTWLKSQPPDAVVFPQSPSDVQDVVRICASHRVPVIRHFAGGTDQRTGRGRLDRFSRHEQGA